MMKVQEEVGQLRHEKIFKRISSLFSLKYSEIQNLLPFEEKDLSMTEVQESNFSEGITFYFTLFL